MDYLLVESKVQVQIWDHQNVYIYIENILLEYQQDLFLRSNFQPSPICIANHTLMLNSYNSSFYKEERNV